jgi:hypothetical protein
MVSLPNPCDFFKYLYYALDLMQKLIIIMCVFILAACSKKGGEKEALSDDRMEITPFKINKIILRDTQSVKTMYFETDSGRLSTWEYREYSGREYVYLDQTQFNAFRKAIWIMVNAPGSKVFMDPNKKALSPQEVRDRVVRCGLMEEVSFDAEGNELLKSRYVCDSTSAIHNINMIRYFESWYFNPKNNMIERELLGYSVHEYVADKFAFRELFNVFVNDQALEKAKKHYFSKFK